MKISILLPYKENFSSNYAGAVSLFVNDIVKNSRYKKNTFVFGSMDFKKPFLKRYINIKALSSGTMSTSTQFSTQSPTRRLTGLRLTLLVSIKKR